jgi:hypothetical protein
MRYLTAWIIAGVLLVPFAWVIGYTQGKRAADRWYAEHQWKVLRAEVWIAPGYGSDANDCSEKHPCASLAGAYDHLAPEGGVIYFLGGPSPEAWTTKTGDARTTKPSSPAVTRSGNTIIYGPPENGNPASWSYPRKSESGLSSPKGGSK